MKTGRHALEIAAVSALFSLGAAAADDYADLRFVIDDISVSDPTDSLVDPEYDYLRSRLTWQDAAGLLWVASIDPATGAIIPPDGRGELIDDSLAPLGETQNGPEWAFGPTGVHIVYTVKSLGVRALSVATEGPDGWEVDLPGNPYYRWSPIGTGPGSATSRISYYGEPTPGNRLITWRELFAVETEVSIPDLTATTGRWAEGGELLVMTADRGGVQQVVAYDVPSGGLMQLTHDPETKYSPFVWHAPEYGERLMMCMVSVDSVAIYREVFGRWTRITRLTLPSQHPFVHSPEPFVHVGKSYISLVATSEFNGEPPWFGQPVGPTEIWLAGIDPSAPFFRKVSVDGNTTRLDPEAFPLENGMAIYYTEGLPDGILLLRRARTGL